MDKTMNFFPVISGLFGFWSVFGYFYVRFLERVRVGKRSVCSVDFVEKLWESLWVNLWETCGKKCGKVRVFKFCTEMGGDLHKNEGMVEKNPHKFTHGLTDQKVGFTQFPQDLLQLLLIR